MISGQSGGPCKQISPILEELSSEYKSKNVTIAKVNIDDNPETPAKYGIMSIPSLLLFKDGKLVSTRWITTERCHRRMD